MTDVFFSFDTEDYTSDLSSDAVRDQAELLRSYGVRGNFNVVGYLAREFIRNRRWDVLDALKYHTVSFHSLRHSYHPTICEYTDIEDYSTARAEFERQESAGMGMVMAACGVDGFPAAVPPGNSLSYAAMYGYADRNIPLYLGSFFETPDGSGVHYCNAFHMDYHYGLEEELFRPDFDVGTFLDGIASMRRCILYNHPNKVMYTDFWDEYNYRRENLRPMYHWIEPPRRSDADIALYYRRLRALLEALCSDSRFTVGSVDALRDKVSAENAARTVTRDMLPEIRSSLSTVFRWVSEPVSLSAADCFFAARHFLFSDEPYHPAGVHGFLEEPTSVSVPVMLPAEEIRALARPVTPEAFLPPYFTTASGVRIGPADLLFAMLDIALGAETAVLLPKKQQCAYEDAYPALRDIQLAHTWLHADTMEDRYLSERLRLQAWTIRPE